MQPFVSTTAGSQQLKSPLNPVDADLEKSEPETWSLHFLSQEGPLCILALPTLLHLKHTREDLQTHRNTSFICYLKAKKQHLHSSPVQQSQLLPDLPQT